MHPTRQSRAGHGQGRHRAPALTLAAGLAFALPALGQATNPWTPPGAMPPPVYAGDAMQAAPGGGFAAVPGWAGAQAASRFAPPDLDARLSGSAPAEAQVPPAPAWAQTPSAPAVLAPPQATQSVPPGMVAPVAPGVPSYPGALPWGAGTATGIVPVTPGPGYGYTNGWPGAGAVPPYGYGYGYGPGAGATGWPGYAPNWGGGGWPGMGFSPFGF